jgi:4-amino-4-deoxy-L-arabinose transferase-like glycosyltransferase
VRQGLSRPIWLAAVIIAFCLPLFVGLGRTDLENDEAIYSYAVDRILATGDWLNPALSPFEGSESKTFHEKPPLKFWIVAAPIRLGILPHNELGMRVWDALFGAMAFIYVFAIGRRLAGPTCGFVAVFVLFVYQPLLFEHGLRNNNMEAPLVLCYCGAVYHYLAWVEAERPALRHIGAIWGYFFLGFMTKLVAAFFLPMILGVASVLDASARRRVREDVRPLLAGAAVFLVFASPWFIYQHVKAGAEFWRELVAEHVYQRFTEYIDPEHVQPWHFYFTVLGTQLQHYRLAWLAAAGGLLLILQTLRLRRLEMVVTIVWFVLPVVLMSLGTSKLHHYLYPFLPPVALAIGYGPAWLLHTSRRYLDTAIETVQRQLTGVRWWSAGLRNALLVLATASVVVAVATLVLGQVDWKVGDVQLLRNSHVARPLAIGIVLFTLAARSPVVTRVLLPAVLLVAVLPANAYEDAINHTRVERHPLRAVSACLLGARSQELQSGRTAPGVYAIGEESWFLHSYFYYLRHVGGWERSSTLDTAAAADALFTPGRQRPVLLADESYGTLKAVHEPALQAVPMLRLPRVLLLTPGPYAECGPKVAALPSGDR